MNPLERAACENYMLNPTAGWYSAMLAAGYSHSSARLAYRLNSRPQAQAYLEKLRQQISKQVVHSAASVVDEFSKLAYVNLPDMLVREPNGWRYKRPDELSDEERACVKSISITSVEIEPEKKDDKGNVIEPPVYEQQFSYTLYSKPEILTQLGRHYGLFEDRVTVKQERAQLNAVPVDRLQELLIHVRGELDKHTAIEGEFEVVRRG